MINTQYHDRPIKGIPDLQKELEIVVNGAFHGLCELPRKYPDGYWINENTLPSLVNAFTVYANQVSDVLSCTDKSEARLSPEEDAWIKGARKGEEILRRGSERITKRVEAIYAQYSNKRINQKIAERMLAARDHVLMQAAGIFDEHTQSYIASPEASERGVVRLPRSLVIFMQRYQWPSKAHKKFMKRYQIVI